MSATAVFSPETGLGEMDNRFYRFSEQFVKPDEYGSKIIEKFIFPFGFGFEFFDLRLHFPGSFYHSLVDTVGLAPSVVCQFLFRFLPCG